MNLKIGWFGFDLYDGPHLHYYFYLVRQKHKEGRQWGFDYLSYDCQKHTRLCFWFFELQWSLPWTAWKPDPRDV